VMVGQQVAAIPYCQDKGVVHSRGGKSISPE
jgi:hypothetical protein